MYGKERLLLMRTLGGALGGQLAATFIAANMASDGLPEVTGFTETFLMATGFLVLCFGAGLLVPRGLGAGSRRSDEEIPIPPAAKAA